MDLDNNPDYKLFYQLDAMRVVTFVVQVGPTRGMRGTFLVVEHGSIAPFVPFVLSLQ